MTGRSWTLGGSGDDWENLRSLNVLSDVASVPDSMQTLELRVDENIVSIIYSAHNTREEAPWELWQKLTEFGVASGNGCGIAREPGYADLELYAPGFRGTWWKIRRPTLTQVPLGEPTELTYAIRGSLSKATTCLMPS